MSKNTILLSVVAVILGAIYVVYFTDWFRKESMQIIPTIRPSRPDKLPRDVGSAAVYPVSFAFSQKHRLTSVKVIAADDLKTNKYPTALWHLISDTASVPTKSLVYGITPKGMKPSIPRARALSLEPGVEYMLLLEAAGSVKAQTNFHTREVVAPAAQ